MLPWTFFFCKSGGTERIIFVVIAFHGCANMNPIEMQRFNV